ncbi:MAG TPA: hypothetical protein HPP72_09545 [Gammaproteobacteria bacterium]|jgi:ACR3 family arsenite efflux pump ArsB|nr:hypothetical protein [Gammaproteobacteria bacterium]
MVRRKYIVLQVAAVLLYIVGVAVIILGALYSTQYASIAGRFGVPGVAILIITIALGLLVIMYAELIYVKVDTERNTRASALYLRELLEHQYPDTYIEDDL